ncbi:MAG: hypothetical protein WA989_18335 [Henriciella sp.]|uniref:hypothetical protein n=1 Tax=Henriciella sp. TaxID=1968823 RepID=UPI003C72FB28
MRYFLILALALPVFAMPAAHAQEADDPTSVPQLILKETAQDGAVDTEQLRSDVRLNETQIEQLQTNPSEFDVEQAEGGKDFCEPGMNPRYVFCEELEKRPLQAAKTTRSTSAEEVLIRGSQSGVDVFARDPASTADQIGRGAATSLAAQSFGDELLNGRSREEKAALESSASGLPPEVLATVGHPPVVTTGN